jgi:hypothetical protein
MTAHPWVPERLLLLRFGLQDPHVNKQPEAPTKDKAQVFKQASMKDGDSYFMQVQQDFEIQQ